MIILIILFVILIIYGIYYWYTKVGESNIYASLTTIPERLRNSWFYNNLKQNITFYQVNYI